MRIWIDVMTPKQARVFSQVYRVARSRGHEVLLTTRLHGETTQILSMEGVPHISVGRHGGRELLSKLKAYAHRALDLVDLVTEFEPHVLMSLSSPEAVRVAFGLGVRVISLNDTPHSVHVGRLTLPLTDRLVYPAAVPAYRWLSLGARAETLRPYYGVDEVSWVLPALERLRFRCREGGLAVVRPEESHAAYLTGGAGQASVVEPCLEFLLDRGYRVVLLPRYDDQGEYFRRRYGDRVVIPDRAVDPVPLYSTADVVISGGGTMSREAAMFGTPAISLFPLEDPLYVDEFLASLGLPLFRSRDPRDALTLLGRIVHDPDEFRVDPRPVLSLLESPVEVLLQEAERLAG